MPKYPVQPLVSRDTLRNPLRGAFALDKNDHVIGVAHEAVAPLFQLAVELVQQDIGQQRGQWAALGRAHLAGFDVLTDQAF